MPPYKNKTDKFKAPVSSVLILSLFDAHSNDLSRCRASPPALSAVVSIHPRGAAVTDCLFVCAFAKCD